MKCKVSRPGSDIDGALGYDNRTGTSRKAVRERPFVRHLGGISDSAVFKKVFELRPDIKKPVQKFAISLAPGERMTEPEWNAYIDAHLVGMGLDPDQFPFCSTLHLSDMPHDGKDAGTEGCEHAHVTCSRIGYDGQVWHGRYSQERAAKLQTALETQFGLTQTPGWKSRKEIAVARLSENEINKALRIGVAPSKTQIKSAIDEAIFDGASDWQSLAHALDAAGIDVALTPAEKGHPAGVKFFHRAAGRWESGSKLGGDYSRLKLARKMNYEEDPNHDNNDIADTTESKRRVPPSIRRDRLHSLSELTLVRPAGTPSVLLQADVPGGPSGRGDHSLRRPADQGSGVILDQASESSAVAQPGNPSTGRGEAARIAPDNFRGTGSALPTQAAAVAASTSAETGTSKTATSTKQTTASAETGASETSARAGAETGWNIQTNRQLAGQQHHSLGGNMQINAEIQAMRIKTAAAIDSALLDATDYNDLAARLIPLNVTLREYIEDGELRGVWYQYSDADGEVSSTSKDLGDEYKYSSLIRRIKERDDPALAEREAAARADKKKIGRIVLGSPTYASEKEAIADAVHAEERGTRYAKRYDEKLDCDIYYVSAGVKGNQRDVDVAWDFEDRIVTTGKLTAERSKLLIDLCRQHAWTEIDVEGKGDLADSIRAELRKAGFRIAGDAPAPAAPVAAIKPVPAVPAAVPVAHTPAPITPAPRVPQPAPVAEKAAILPAMERDKDCGDPSHHEHSDDPSWAGHEDELEQMGRETENARRIEENRQAALASRQKTMPMLSDGHVDDEKFRAQVTAAAAAWMKSLMNGGDTTLSEFCQLEHVSPDGLEEILPEAMKRFVQIEWGAAELSDQEFVEVRAQTLEEAVEWAEKNEILKEEEEGQNQEPAFRM